MEFNKQTPIIVRAFHYDLLDEPEEKNEVNVAICQVVTTGEDGVEDAGEAGGYYEVAVVYDVTPDEDNIIEISGVNTQVVQLLGYHGDGQDLDQETYRLLSRPLVEYIETLTYEVSQVALDEPINLDFEPNF